MVWRELKLFMDKVCRVKYTPEVYFIELMFEKDNNKTLKPPKTITDIICEGMKTSRNFSIQGWNPSSLNLQQSSEFLQLFLQFAQ